MPQQTDPLIFPWCRTSCACGAEVAVIAQAGWSWVPSAGDPGTAHPDVEACTFCHLLTLKPGALTVSESNAARRFRPDLRDLARRAN